MSMKISRNIFIYLSGSIQKSHHESPSSCWTEEHINQMKKLFLSKEINVVFLNPASRSDDLSDEKSLFGRDMLQVYLSTCVLVDGREKRGIGIGYEMAAANFKKIPVFSWVPNESHYRPKEMVMLGQKLQNWRHPFFQNPSEKLIENLEDAVEVISGFPFKAPDSMHTNDFILPAMKHYINKNLDRDVEMKTLVEAYSELRNKIESIASISLPSDSSSIEADSKKKNISQFFPKEIKDLNCSKLSEGEIGFLKNQLSKHKLLVIRNQNLTKEEQLQFTQHFGIPEVAWDSQDPGDSRIQIVSNRNANHYFSRNKTSSLRFWHADTSFMKEPTRYTFLHARSIPSDGGDTKFINTQLAYEGLDDSIKERINHKEAFHTFKFILELWDGRKDSTGFNYPDVAHPLVLESEDGTKSLYLSKLGVSHIKDMELKESEKLLTILFEHCKKEEYRYRHKWKEGDLLIWDNSATMHKGTFCNPDDGLRELNRTNVKFTSSDKTKL